MANTCAICHKPLSSEQIRLKCNCCSPTCAHKRRYAWPDWFWRKVTKSDGCWEWTGSCGAKGYGQVGVKGKNLRTHRVSWELTNGKIPEQLIVCHHCDNPKCVRPDHLFLGTNKDNTQDMLSKGRQWNQHIDKTHCPQGHPYSGDNLIVSVKGWRYCRTCQSTKHLSKRQSPTGVTT